MQLITKPPHGSVEWLQTRWRDEENKVLFGASDAPILMGASPYRSRADLFVDKSVKPTQKGEDKPEFRRGNLLEKPLLQVASEVLNTEILTPNFMYRHGRFAVSLDGVDNEQEPSVVVEAKTTSAYAIETAEDLPIEWLWQGTAQQLVTGLPVWFVVLDRRMNISVVEMTPNVEAAKRLREEAEEFAVLVETQQPLSSDFDKFTADQIALMYRATPTSVDLTDEAVELVLALEAARTQRKKAEEAEKEAKDSLAKILLNNEIGLYQGEKVVSWKEQKGRTSFDTVRFKQDFPELFHEYEKEGAPFRVLRTHREG